MQGKQNQWLQTLNFPRQETLSKQIMQLEGSSSWSGTAFGIFVYFPSLFKRDIAYLFTFLLFQNGALFSRAKWLAISTINKGFSLVNIFAQRFANQNCGMRCTREPGTRHICWYYPLAQQIAVIRRKLSIWKHGRRERHDSRDGHRKPEQTGQNG